MSNLLSLTVILIGSILLLGGFVLILKRKKDHTKTDSDRRPNVDSECCGAHEVCEKESLLSGISPKIEYYDDDELDRFRGKNSHEYSEEEIDEFRAVFYTLQEPDVAGWVRSLQLREIMLPDDLKDEVILVIGERRFRHH